MRGEYKHKVLLYINFGIALLVGILLMAVFAFIWLESRPIWFEVGIINFITGLRWAPAAVSPFFGIAPMIASTLWTALGAILISAPLGISGAIFLARFAPYRLAALLRPVINILTGIPSVVYGFLGAAILVRFFQDFFSMPSGESLFAASVVLGIMILPYIVANSEAAIRAVPQEYADSALALGVSDVYTVFKVLLPLARRGIISAVVLAFARAAGETMAVLMLAGNTLNFPLSWFSKGEPLSALIALELGSAAAGTLHYQALFGAGFVLLVIVTGVNIAVNIYRYWAREEEPRY